MRRTIFFFTLFLIVPSFAQSAPRTSCGFHRSGGYDVHYCYEPGDPNSNQVVYYFHGIGGNEQKWETSRLHAALGQHLVRSPAPRPHVFSISFGRAWFFTDEKGAGRDTRLNAFLSLIPVFEAELPLPPTRRTVVGESMGGYNALRLSMEAPQLFQQVVALCPALLPIGPYSSQPEIDAFKERNKQYLNVRLLETIRWWAMTEFTNQESWVRNNPLDRATLPVPLFPPLFLSEYIRDEYGFPEGTTLFASRMMAQGHLVTMRTEDAGHCRHSDSLLSEASSVVMSTPAPVSTPAMAEAAE